MFDILLPMRLPNRKPGKYTFPTFDPTMTQAKFTALQAKVQRIKTELLPQAIKDTQKYGENGDFSENAEYQIAKGRLRGLNRTLAELQYQLAQAKIITPPSDTITVQIGHTVVISTNTTQHTFQILGSTETNPTAGIISHHSPLGAALLGHRVGETVILTRADSTVVYTIIAIH